MNWNFGIKKIVGRLSDFWKPCSEVRKHVEQWQQQSRAVQRADKSFAKHTAVFRRSQKKALKSHQFLTFLRAWSHQQNVSLFFWVFYSLSRYTLLSNGTVLPRVCTLMCFWTATTFPYSWCDMTGYTLVPEYFPLTCLCLWGPFFPFKNFINIDVLATFLWWIQGSLLHLCLLQQRNS